MSLSPHNNHKKDDDHDDIAIHATSLANQPVKLGAPYDHNHNHDHHGTHMHGNHDDDNPSSPIFGSIFGAANDDYIPSSSHARSSQPSSSTKWYRRPVALICFMFIAIIIIGLAIGVGLLYPRKPRISVVSVSVSDTTAPLRAITMGAMNLTLHLEIDVWNPNYLSANYDNVTTKILISSSIANVLSLTIPSGYTKARSTKRISLVLPINNLQLPPLTQVAEWANNINVRGIATVLPMT